MNKPRLTSAVRRGLIVIDGLASADYEVALTDDSPRWNAQQRREIERAFEYLRAIINRPRKEPTAHEKEPKP